MRVKYPSQKKIVEQQKFAYPLSIQKYKTWGQKTEEENEWALKKINLPAVLEKKSYVNDMWEDKEGERV